MFSKKLILGTAQIGMNYGVNNFAGKIPIDETFRIFDFAFSNGIDTIETAEDYGDATAIIGKYHKQSKNKFNVILNLT